LTSGRGSGVVGYNVQVTVDTEHHLIVTHEATNSGSDRAQLANMARQAKAALKTETLEVVADRGYFSSPEILACHEAGITVTPSEPQTSGAKSEGRFGKQDYVYSAGEGRLSLSGWGAIAISIYQRGRWQADEALPDHSPSKLFAQIPVHDGARAADSTMGA
jgi:Transposase DDE domain